MKKFYLFACCIFLAAALTAQPTLQYPQNAPAVGDLTEIQFVSPVGLTHLPAGPNVTWVYTDITNLGPAGTIEGIDPSVAPNGNLFPQCNVALSWNDSTYTYVMVDESGIYYVGNQLSLGIYNVLYNYSDPRKFMEFPFTFGGSFSDAYKGTSTAEGVEIRVTASSIVTADAYGTLILPSGTFSNVLRTKTIDTEIDSIFIGGTFLMLVPASRTQYSWFSQNSHGPLFSMEIINAMGETDTVCYYLKEEAGIPDPGASIQDMKIYPNPAEDHAYVEFIPAAGQTYSLSLVNQVGQEVRTMEITGAPGKQLRKKIDLGTMHAGIYFVKLRCDCGKQLTRKLVIR